MADRYNAHVQVSKACNSLNLIKLVNAFHVCEIVRAHVLLLIYRFTPRDTFGHVSMRITKKSRSDIDSNPYRTVPTKVESLKFYRIYD